MTRFEYQLWGALAMASRGNDLPHARLDPSKVQEIRANVRGMTARQLADLYGVHYRTIEKIRARETWAHVESRT